MSSAYDPSALIADIRAFLGITDADAAALAPVREAVRRATPQIVDQFYELLQSHAPAARVLEGPEQVARLKASLGRWLDELFAGPWDAAYAASRRRVGQVHVRTRLPQRYVIGAVQHVQRSLHDVIYAQVPDEAGRRRVLTALHRVLAMDLALMVESYQLEREEEAVGAFMGIARRTSDVVFTARSDGRILWVNQDCGGVTRDRLLAGGTTALLAPQSEDSRERLRGAWAAVVQTGEPQSNTPIEFRHPESGEWRHCLVTLVPDAGADGRVDLVHAILRDVSELRALEADVEERRRLASIGEMVAGVAHEVRNPLQNVMLGLRKLQEAAEPDRRAAAAEQARDGVEQIERLVSDLLSFSKRLSLSTSQLDAVELMQSAVDASLVEYPDRSIAAPAAPPSGPVRVVADPFRLPQALRNLLQNALDATTADQLVMVAVEVPDAEHVDFVVADGGPGLPARVRARLFEPFVTTRPRGTGLGLAIARRLVEAHGGRLVFEDRPGGGTVARVRLPRASDVTPR